MTAAMTTEWEAVVGIEVHVELQTDSKMFCACAVDADAPPNTLVCPVCLALPGSLPVTNRRAIEWITAIGLALDCEITTDTVFSRKNYFYADIPKGYQISQFDLPVCVDGHLDIEVDGEVHRVGIERAHMEEDTAKTLHVGDTGRIHEATGGLVDFNRAGVPLVEIVSRPDLRSGAQARAYAQALRQVVLALGVSDARLEEGSMRFDANVSVRPVGESELGTKVEIKNMNSFRSLERAVDHEFRRQVALVTEGGTVVQETRHWDEADGRTHAMRTKEGSSDYRYFTEPDLPPMHLDESWVAPIRARLPELPAARLRRLEAGGIPRQTAAVLMGEPVASEVFFTAVERGADAAGTANFLTQEVIPAHTRAGVEFDADSPFADAGFLVEFDEMRAEGVLSSNGMAAAVPFVLAGEGSPRQVAEAHDLVQISDAGALEAAVDEAIAANPDEWDRFVDGERKLTGFFVGQVMRATGGKADPKAVARILAERA